MPRVRAQYWPMGRALYMESVADAAAIAGGHERLAAELGVSIEKVECWLTGAETPECSVFLRLIDFVTGASGPKGRSATAEPAAESRGNAAANPLSLEA